MSLSDGQKQKILDSHNKERSIHCVSPLVWDPTLEKFSKQWADNCVWGHWGSTSSIQKPTINGQNLGENLSMSSGNLDVIDSGMSGWISEKEKWQCGSAISSNQTAQTGHYTQMIWLTTQKIGCSVAKCDFGDYLVCEYFPAGNWIGQPTVQSDNCFKCASGSSVPPVPVTTVTNPPVPVTTVTNPSVPVTTVTPSVPVTTVTPSTSVPVTTVTPVTTPSATSTSTTLVVFIIAILCVVLFLSLVFFFM